MYCTVLVSGLWHGSRREEWGSVVLVSSIILIVSIVSSLISIVSVASIIGVSKVA
jgi:hypothetical protein